MLMPINVVSILYYATNAPAISLNNLQGHLFTFTTDLRSENKLDRRIHSTRPFKNNEMHLFTTLQHKYLE